jgi:hypothetical protein
MLGIHLVLQRSSAASRPTNVEPPRAAPRGPVLRREAIVTDKDKLMIFLIL